MLTVLIAHSKLHCLQFNLHVEVRQAASAHWSLPFLAKAGRPPVLAWKESEWAFCRRAGCQVQAGTFPFASLKKTRSSLALDHWKDGLQPKSAFASDRGHVDYASCAPVEIRRFPPNFAQKIAEGADAEKDACVLPVVPLKLTILMPANDWQSGEIKCIAGQSQVAQWLKMMHEPTRSNVDGATASYW